MVVALDGKSSAHAALDIVFTSARRLQVELLVLSAGAWTQSVANTVLRQSTAR